MVNEALWIVANTIIRISALLHIKKILHSPLWWISMRVLLNVAIFYGLAALLGAFLICRPAAAAWNNSLNGTCANQMISYLLLEVIGALIDAAILILPMPSVLQIPMARKQKIGVISLLSVGVLFVSW